jgi:hypothetical protein
MALTVGGDLREVFDGKGAVEAHLEDTYFFRADCQRLDRLMGDLRA